MDIFWRRFSIGTLLFVSSLSLAWYVRRLVRTSKSCFGVVITGSTRGIGLALAQVFLKYGDKVVISGRNQDTVAEVVSSLKRTFPGTEVFGQACDVTSAESVEALAQFAKQVLPSLDIWINNAGVSQNVKAPLSETPHAELRAIIETNLLGTMYGCQSAIRVMRGQANGGHIFLMEGAGSDSMTTPNSAAYGVSKRGLGQLARTLNTELRKTKVAVHRLNPGMAITEMLMLNTDLRSRRFFNILAEMPSTVAAWLVPLVRYDAACQLRGEAHRFLTPVGVVWRLATFLWRRNRLIDEKTGTVLAPSVF